MWIALNKESIGIHGTDDPDSIGLNASHGCIRLANWDVATLAGMVKPGFRLWWNRHSLSKYYSANCAAKVSGTITVSELGLTVSLCLWRGPTRIQAHRVLS